MFNAVRRGPSSIARSLSFVTSNSECIRTALPHGARRSTRLQSSTSFLLRSFGTSPQWRRFATSTAAVEDEAVGGEIEQEIHAEHPPSDARMKEATSNGPVTRFEELGKRGMVCQTVVDTITQGMGLETMTQVQSMTIDESLKGIDVLAQARTGTGKTLAFLVPVLQNIIKYDPSLEKRTRLGHSGASTDIRALIISPTRELAEQIAVEARKVTKDTAVVVQTAVGGSSKAAGLRKIKYEGCHILVGTPGRLKDLLSDPYSQVRAPNLSALVLDEADRMLDMGFAPDIEAIQELLPDRKQVDRQTLLYSATIPREIMPIVKATVKPNFKFVRTVQEGEQQTHERVPQKIVNVGGFENLMPALVELCQREIAASNDANNDSARPFKAIIYFGATSDVALASATFQNLRNPGSSIFHQHPLHPAKIIEIQGRLSQEARTRAAETFKRAKSGLLLSSDVTARGMDFPDVTHVIQMGLPPSEDQYVHRLGRTARGDKSGEGWIFIVDLEAREVHSRLRNIPLTQDDSLETARVDMKKDAQLPENTAKTLTQVGDAIKMVPRHMKALSYMAALGVYSWLPRKQDLVTAMNNRARYGWGMETPPMVSRGVIERLKLRNVEGLNIGSEDSGPSTDGERGGFSGRLSFGGRGGLDRGGLSSVGGGNRGDRGGGYGRSNYGDRGDRGGRSSYSGGDREGHGGGSGRSSYGGRGGRGGRGDRGGGYGRSSYGDRGDRGERGGGYGRSSYGDRSDRGGGGSSRHYDPSH